MNGVINGMDDGGVYPQNPITRAQMAVMVLRFTEKPAE